MFKAIFPIGIGLLVILILGILGGQSFGWWMGGGLIVFTLAILAFKGADQSAKAKQGNEWSDRFPGATYKFAHGDFGIVADESAKVLHLMESGRTKSYGFSDVREWTTKLQTGGGVAYGGGGAMNALAVGSTNREQQKNNAQNSGLFVSVRDVDKPVWRISFSKDEAEEKAQQARWHEILTQLLRDR